MKGTADVVSHTAKGRVSPTTFSFNHFNRVRDKHQNLDKRALVDFTG